jgi:hypothetical protein
MEALLHRRAMKLLLREEALVPYDRGRDSNRLMRPFVQII